MAGKPRQGREPGEFAETGPGARGEQCDAELMVRARAGDDTAFGVLYKRHLESAHRLARLYASTPADAEDIASEGFTQVLSAVRAGGGPREAFRPYVLTTVRRIAVRRAAGAKRDMPTPELESYSTPIPFEDPVLADLEASLVARAFAALPERWQAVLWHTAVEGESPAQVAEHLGLSANGVAALAVRAREGLRKEYLQAHLSAEKMERECRRCASKLAAYVRGPLSARARRRVEEHLADCDRCAPLLPELREISGRLRGILAPLILGPVFAGYFTSPADGSPGETADGTGEPAEGAEEPAGPDDDRGPGEEVAGGGASTGPAVAVVSLAAVVVAFAVAGSFLLSEGSISRPRTVGRAPVTGPSPTPALTTASAPPAPASSHPMPPLPTESRPGDRRVGPGPKPTPGTSADRTNVPSNSPSNSPSSTPSNGPGPVPDPRLSDGAFESPSVGDSDHIPYGNGQFIGGWRVENSVNLTGSKAWQPANGTQSLDLNGDPPGPANGAISQSLATEPGQQYTVSYYLAGNPICGPAVKSLTVQVADVSKDFSFDTTGHSASAMGWRPETVRFTANGDRTTLRLASTTDPNSACGPAIDNVKVAARNAAH
ncbi:choice-of-anchor C family protein [Streptomyces sp. NBC_01481]|uniref:choice-of-anchor C family protein n=1 Tax=Streptomyces sp. NBC_01481 TaxID=2975869 RepID=UPI00225B23EF|nr:choice-of-anchor C family protein [Streptomyces sp. NBC_01481]MCX4588134.1 choice-of-anchor C family protein [Streptomyces sp. NBC_01481]